jgi:hypothetical protein
MSNKSDVMVSAPMGWRCPSRFWTWLWNPRWMRWPVEAIKGPCSPQEKEAGLVQGEPPVLLGEADLASQLPKLKSPVGLFGVWHLWLACQWDFSQHTGSLIQKIKELKGTIYRDTMAKVCRRSLSRTEYMVKAGGDFIQYKLWPTNTFFNFFFTSLQSDTF